jgi:hypothetical protein|tara:strand:- start:19 stop:162 length:144 start_codon:yes stop_codon:yes gene_type:complete
MTISRSQISKQVDGKLRGARDEKKKDKKTVKKNKPLKKNPLSRTFTV